MGLMVERRIRADSGDFTKKMSKTVEKTPRNSLLSSVLVNFRRRNVDHVDEASIFRALAA